MPRPEQVDDAFGHVAGVRIVMSQVRPVVLSSTRPVPADVKRPATEQSQKSPDPLEAHVPSELHICPICDVPHWNDPGVQAALHTPALTVPLDQVPSAPQVWGTVPLHWVEPYAHTPVH
jgi:hypothetical protein